MALTVKSLGLVSVDTNVVTQTTLYTVPASTTAIIREITVADADSGAATATVQVFRSAVAYSISGDVMDNSTTVLSRQLVLSALDVLRIDVTVAKGSAGTAFVTVSGAEIT